MPSPALVADTLRTHRAGMLAWVVGGTVAMVGMSVTLAKEMREFPGGPKGLEASVMPGAQAMRPIRWPAEHLDTLGGYLTYHNILLFAFFLAVYGALQGARAIRGAEERHSLEVVLATGWSRTSVVRDRAIGFLISLAVITIGLALGVAWSMAAGGEPNLSGSFVTITATGLIALVAYAMTLLISQLTRTARAAAGIGVIVLTALYVATNVWEDLGAFGVVRFISPFYYANNSRALVPGHGLDSGSFAALLIMTVVLLALAAAAFQRRDYSCALWVRRAPERTITAAEVRVQRWWLRSIWRVTLLRGRLGLLAWALASAAFTAMYMSLEPTVLDSWALFEFMAPMIGGGPGTSPETLYTSFVAEIVSPVIAAYVITQAAAWVADLEQGRVEVYLSAPLTWSGLVRERLVALTVGVAVITVASVGSVAIGAVGVGSGFDSAGLVRLTAMCILLGLALGAIAAIAVAVTRSGIAVVCLALYVGAAYLFTLIAPVFGWPEWLSRLSIFDAVGHPYLETPSAAGLAVLLVLAIPGSLIAAAIAERTPKVP